MTWWRGEGRYEVFFNRDELKTRSRALPPEPMTTRQGIRFLAPTDPDAGGAWMLVNEYGVSVSLLNRWHQDTNIAGPVKSRGQLVLSLASAKSAQEVILQLRETDHSQHNPFTLVAIDPLETLVEAWDGSRLFSEKAAPPLTSSSYCFPEVSQARYDSYECLLGNDTPSLKKYHAGGEDQSAYTVRMNRPDAQTWSRSWLRIGDHKATWQYLEEMPDLVAASIEHNSLLDLRP